MSTRKAIELDLVEMIDGNVIQHGKYNDRAYLMKLGGLPAFDEENAMGQTAGKSGQTGPERAVEVLEELGEKHHYGKLFAKVPAPLVNPFIKAGYRVEARVPHLYRGVEDACFVGRYLKGERLVERKPLKIQGVLQGALRKTRKDGRAIRKVAVHQLPPEFQWKIGEPDDVPSICRIYREVFKTYPFPIHDENYLRSTMEEGFVYFCVTSGAEMVAVSSCEVDKQSLSVEMTDFATLPRFRGVGLSKFLLAEMEKRMCEDGVLTAFTIARALSSGMNGAFARCGYEYAGTLTNNTNICGSLESMNVWHKPLVDLTD